MKWFCLFILSFIFSAPAFAQFSEDDLLIEVAPEAIQTPPADDTQPTEEGEGAAAIAEQLQEKGDLEDEPYKIAIEASVTLNYVFAESPDSFIVTYKLKSEGIARNKVDAIKNKGEVQTEVNGFLAKWSSGACQLKIDIGSVPFEVIFSKVEEDQVRLDVKWANNIAERWESNCTFEDDPKAKFDTSGGSESWLAKSLRRITPNFSELLIPIDRLHKETSKVEFQIERFLLADPPVGSVEMEGKGTIAIIPTTL